MTGDTNGPSLPCPCGCGSLQYSRRQKHDRFASRTPDAWDIRIDCESCRTRYVIKRSLLGDKYYVPLDVAGIWSWHNLDRSGLARVPMPEQEISDR